MKVTAFLPVKGSSERIENKNTKLLDGKPLFLHTLEKLLTLDFIDDVYLDTESESIIDLASHTNTKVLRRDPALATNATDGNKLFMNEVNSVYSDIYIQILGTSPFISGETIKKGIDLLTSTTEYDSATLVKREKQYTWSTENLRPNYNLEKIPNSVNLTDTIIETMGLYIIKREAAISTQRRIGKNTFLLDATALEAIDVNFPDDFELANLIASGKRERERYLLRNLSYRLTSSMLSDVMDELGYPNQFIGGLQLNSSERKVFGRAKTLHITERTNQSTNTIYDALGSYDFIVPGDIIVVKNDLPSYAYFGELNANLAIRSGAICAIIDGKTRDSSEVKSLHFPVFSRGFSSKDIKHYGTLGGINKQIMIENVTINYEDLVFGDADGIIVIPKQIESKVLSSSLEIIRKENHILIDVATGITTMDIRKKFGDF